MTWIHPDSPSASLCPEDRLAAWSPRRWQVAAVAGGVSVGRGGYLGMNCCLREGVRVGRFAVVGMGGVVVRDVGDELVVAGNPARPLRSGR